jgi:murein L,D-transpeptidase YcbB/YkuD
MTSQIADLLEGRQALPLELRNAQGGVASQEVSDLYRGRDFRPLWQARSGLRIAAFALLERLRSAADHGLCGEDYLLVPIERLMSVRAEAMREGRQLSPQNLALLDLFLSQAFFSYGSDLVEGRIDPALTHNDWRGRRRKLDLVKLLPSAVDGDSLSALLAELAPPHQGYRELMGALTGLKVLAARGGWPQVAEGEKLEPGAIDSRLPQLRARLLVTGELPKPNSVEGNAYGPATVAAVKLFQKRHGLDPDGVIGKRTVLAMNVTVEQRIRQIEINLERWRWMPRELGKRHIRVNIADFTLKVVEDGAVVMEMPVIVGRPYRRTPVFSSQMSYLEFAPTWTVPATVLREDKLPAIRKDPGFLAKNHFRVFRHSSGKEVAPGELAAINWHQVEPERFPGELRMDPGPWNPLGKVKFMFPNAFNVYLHDTNERGLFDRYKRTYSSGCIRIGDPVGLARYLLQDQPKWTEERLQEALARSTPLQVSITNPMPTHLQYWTTWVDADGTIQFRSDLYYRDLDMEVALGHVAARTGQVVAKPAAKPPLRVSRLN